MLKLTLVRRILVQQTNEKENRMKATKKTREKKKLNPTKTGKEVTKKKKFFIIE